MKSFLFILLFTVFYSVNSFSQTEFNLNPSQSMLMTGKGEGQDGAINPYFGEDCYAIIENMGATKFSIRIQEKEKIVKIVSIEGQATKKLKLLKKQALYFDTNDKEKAQVKLSFEQIEK